jgi:beta-lactamase regulating signal transducer with metallopeptidase domain
MRLFCVSEFIPSQELNSLAVFESGIAKCLLATWLGGIAIRLVQLTLGMLQSLRLVRHTRVVDDNTFQKLLGDAEDRLGHGLRDLEFRISSKVKTPYCWHLSRPTIVLPEGFIDAPASETQAIVRHELAHLRLGHPMQLFLQRLVEAVYWHLPPVWWASRQANRHREFVCDDEAIRTTREASSYLKGLLLVSQSDGRPLELSAGWAFRAERSLIQERTARIADQVSAGAGPLARTAVRRKLIAAAFVISLIWLPTNVAASARSLWSPWPSWTARMLHEFGIVARDYEIDAHRLQPHRHRPVELNANTAP